jgi:hypothetical protein
MSSRGSICRRCGCRDTVSGRQLGSRWPRLSNSWHRSWYLAVDLPGLADGCLRHRIRRGGYPTRTAAVRAPGGFVFTNRRGQPLNPDHLYCESSAPHATQTYPPIRLHDLRHGVASLATPDHVEYQQAA